MLSNRVCRFFALFLFGVNFLQVVPETSFSYAPSLTEHQKYVHLLSRLTFGSRPGDMGRVEKLGVEGFIYEQLEPRSIDDKTLEEMLQSYRTLNLSSSELYKQYPRQDKPEPKKEEGPQTILRELSQAKLLRAIHSERQLQEVMVDFWFNHFNVFASKGDVSWLVTSYDRDVIRPRALGRFRDLLGAVAKSPAMLIYLDNATSSIDPRYVPDDLRQIMEMREKRRQRQNKKYKMKGLNENYARELLELHTLGVDGGYTQKDIIEVARALTGWSIERPRAKDREGEFKFIFRKRMHDPGKKFVLNQTFGPGQGMDEGERILDMLAQHPSTAKFIATKLCRRFVSDQPPPELIDRAARRFSATNGDIRETLKEIFLSPHFFDPSNFRSKVKSPLEFVASAVRTTDAEVRDPQALVGAVNQMGQPLYLCEPPTGYSDLSETWINAGALLDRMNFALRLARSKKMADIRWREILGSAPQTDGRQVVERLFLAFLGGEVSEPTRRVLGEKLNDPEITQSVLDDSPRELSIPKLAALVIGSPDFQRK